MSGVVSKRRQAKPTVSILYYVLGNLRSRWRAIGKSLGVSDSTLEAIKKDHRLCDRRMIEMLECWCLNCMDCKWGPIVTALQRIGEEKLAKKVQHYTSELQRIESELAHNCCKRLVPLKHYCYDDWVLKEMYGDLETVIRDQDKRGIVDCLLDVATKWYQIGISLQVEKKLLDVIDESQDTAEMKLVQMVDRLVKIGQCKWRVLIQVLSEMDLCGSAHSIQSLTDPFKDMPASFHFREFRRKDFTPTTTTQDVTENTHCQMCIRDIKHLLNISQFQHIAFQGFRIKDEKTQTATDICVEQIIDITIEKSRELEERCKEVVEEYTTVCRIRAQLQEDCRRLNLKLAVLEAEKTRIERALEITAPYSETDSTKKLQLQQLQGKKCDTESTFLKSRKLYKECIHKWHTETTKFKFVHQKIQQLEQLYTHMENCCKVFRSCHKYTQIGYTQSFQTENMFTQRSLRPHYSPINSLLILILCGLVIYVLVTDYWPVLLLIGSLLLTMQASFSISTIRKYICLLIGLLLLSVLPTIRPILLFALMVVVALLQQEHYMILWQARNLQEQGAVSWVVHNKDRLMRSLTSYLSRIIGMLRRILWPSPRYQDISKHSKQGIEETTRRMNDITRRLQSMYLQTMYHL